MVFPNKLCPMCFSGDPARTNSMCVGALCSWYDEAVGACAISALSGTTSGQKAKTAKKKPAEE